MVAPSVVLLGPPGALRDALQSTLTHAGMRVSTTPPGDEAGQLVVVVMDGAVTDPRELLGSLPDRLVIALRDGGRAADLLDVVVRSRDAGPLDAHRLIDLVLRRGPSV
jgi:hypothetical protein